MREPRDESVAVNGALLFFPEDWRERNRERASETREDRAWDRIKTFVHWLALAESLRSRGQDHDPNNTVTKIGSPILRANE
jgi:hypothetical protein